jgi:hypothetical protein
MLFREYLEEAVPTFNIGDFSTPPPRAKFQIGDIVVVRDDGRWLMYQSKKSAPYVNQVGKVVGYKNIPGSYTKFAVEFRDGAKVPIHGHFLFGPFKDVNVAKQYADDPKKEIKPVEFHSRFVTEMIIEIFIADDVYIRTIYAVPAVRSVEWFCSR